MATIRDVAKLANVSLGTVSNFINGTSPVSLKKQKAIIEAMDVLNFETNSAAKALKAKTSSDVGLILPNVSNPYYQKLLIGIENYISGHGYSLLVHTTNDVPEKENKALQVLLQKQVAGLLLITCQPDNSNFLKNKLLKKKLPTVLIDRKINNLVMNHISCDNRSSVYQITKALIQAGKQKIVYFGGPDKFTDQADAYEGFISAYTEQGSSPNLDLIFHSTIHQESAFAQMLQIYMQHRPDAVIATSEELALGAREAVKLFGNEAANQLEIHALGEESWTSVNTENIHYSNRRAITLGKEAASVLCAQIADPSLSDIVIRTVKDGKSLGNVDYSENTAPRSNKVLKVTMMNMVCAEALKKLIPIFEQRYGITLDVEMVEHLNYHNYVRQQIASDTPPDIVLLDTLLLPVLAYEKALHPLDSYVKDSAMDTSFYAEDCLERVCMQRGVLYGLPIYYTPQILLYRKDLFYDTKIRNKYESKTGIKLRPPRTWVEFDHIADFFTAKRNHESPTKYGTSLACRYPECMASELRVRMQAYKGKVTDGRKVVFDSPENHKAFFHLQQAIKYCPPDFAEKDRYAIESDFIAGNAAMVVTFESILYKAFSQNMLDSIGISMVPGSHPVLGGWCLCIPSKASHKDEAFQFLRWACGKDIATQQLILSGQTVDKDLLKNDELSHRFPWLGSWREALQYASPAQPIMDYRGNLIEASEIDKVLFQVAYQIIGGNMSVENAVHWGHQEFTQLFSGQKIIGSKQK